MNVLEFLSEYKYHILAGLVVLFFILLYIFRDKISKWTSEHQLVDIPIVRSKQKKYRCQKKFETKCREIFERLIGKKFPSIRPKWLKNSVSGKPLELDGYNEELQLAFEYCGVQHYKYTPFYHKRGYGDFLKQVERDKLKAQICKERNIRLIVIPHTVEYSDLEQYIKLELKNF